MNKLFNSFFIPRLKETVFSLVFLLILGILYGCGGNLGLAKRNITFHVMPDSSINNGQPLYIVIRKVNKKSFLLESYDEIADMVYSDPPDESLLAWHPLLPGKKDKIKVEKPKKNEVAIYAMFTQPGEGWKIMLKSPLGSKYDINIKNDNLTYRKAGLWARLRRIIWKKEQE